MTTITAVTFDSAEVAAVATTRFDAEQIVAINLDTYAIASRSTGVAVWLKDEPDPRYFPHGGLAAQSLISWAMTAMTRPQWVALPQHLFAVAAIREIALGDEEILVFLDGHTLPFAFAALSAAHDLLTDWAIGRAAVCTLVLPAVADE
jgi:hypothetical protein